MSQSFTLISPRVRDNALEAVRSAPDWWIVTVKEPKRTDAQNRHFHALCGDIANSGLKWAGKPRKASEWKSLLVSAHSVATNEGSDIVPGLEGEFINLRESTALMSKKRGASLIEYTMAFALTNGVELVETVNGGFMGLQERAGE